MTSTPGQTNRPFQNAASPGTGNNAGGLLSRVSRTAPPPAQPRFAASGPGTRSGANALTWEILPLGDALACFSLEGLGGSLKYLTGDDGVLSGSGSYEAVLKSVEGDPRALEKLKNRLDKTWADYGLKGAILVHSWRPTTREVMLAHATVKNVRPVLLRAFDPLLVMNVLARTRENLLQPRAPLSFDRAYLERALISDDARLVQLVHNSGYLEEVIQAPPALADEEARNE